MIEGKRERGNERGSQRERESGGGGRNECEKWKVASRVKYNTCLSVCLCLVVYRSEGSVGLTGG